MKPIADIHTALQKLFPHCGVSIYEQSGAVIANVNSAPGESVYLKFQDMPKIAEAFGTERLDFEAIAGADHVDSHTFDGTLLNIVGRTVYALGARTKPVDPGAAEDGPSEAH